MQEAEDSSQRRSNGLHLRSSSPFEKPQFPITNPSLNRILKTDSARSSQSDLSGVSSDNRRVSFNNDVAIKRFNKPKQQPRTVLEKLRPVEDLESGPFARVTKEAAPSSKAEIASEAALVLEQLRGVECRVSNFPQTQAPPPPVPPPPPPPTSTRPIATSPTAAKTVLSSNISSSCEDEADSGLQLSSSGAEAVSSSMRVSDNASKDTNRLFGLHALNNLDIAVNGKNSMQAYAEPRGSNGHIDNLSGIDRPTKPPRRSTVSPEARMPSNYAQPSRTSSSMVSSMMDQLNQDSRFRRNRSRFQETSCDDMDDGTTDAMSNITSSYSPRDEEDKSAIVQRRTVSPRLSPSRTCMTDTELLRSPTEVLYAVSDKYRPNNHNERVAHSSSQTMQSELQHRQQQHRAITPSTSYERKPVATRSRPTSAVDDRIEKNQHRNAYVTRSLERYGDEEDNKENTYRARIQVVSPDRGTGNNGGIYRRPYKTTINTATDNIQYRGNTNNDVNRSLYNKNAAYRGRPEAMEHYKVPRNNVRNGYRNNYVTDSDQSSAVFYGNRNNNFASTRLVKNMDGPQPRGQIQPHPRELDREGRTIRRESGHRHRTYSGGSTSPDREISPDRGGPGGYSRPRAPPRSYSGGSHRGVVARSPSTSPTRPPRARSSPGRELITNVVRRVSGRGRNEVERTPSNRVRQDSRTRSAVIDDEERLARFTEYRGGNSHDADNLNRRSSNAYDDIVSGGGTARNRGQSLPPGANIDSMRDFYKSAEYKSMYALPPSPNRPAPVLDRATSSSTLNRPGSRTSGNMRPNRVSISEGEITDEGKRIRRITAANANAAQNRFHNGVSTERPQ